MTRDGLIAAVPIHEHNGRPFFVRLSEVPGPWRAQFSAALVGSQVPRFDGEGEIAYAWDWKSWTTDSWYGRQGPSGLDEPTP